MVDKTGFKTFKAINGSYSYNPSDELGRGAFGSVYKGTNTDTNEIVAIKLVNVQKLLKQYKSNEIVKAVGRECNILQKLTEGTNNPYIVKIYDCCKIKSHVYIILEFCDGGSLEDVCSQRNGKLAEKDAKVILYQIVLGLQAIHSKNIAHRDMKPDNIFIRGKYFKLGDFGFATDKNKFTTQLGTQPYMAPEILSSDPNYTVKVDIWALGVMYHQMLFGELPFKAGTLFQLQDLFKNMKQYEIPKNTNVKLSKESIDVLQKLLHKDVSQRVTAEQISHHPLFESIKDNPFIEDAEEMLATLQPSLTDNTPNKYVNANSGWNGQQDFQQPKSNLKQHNEQFANANSTFAQPQTSPNQNFQQLPPQQPQQRQSSTGFMESNYAQPGYPSQQQPGLQSQNQPGYQSKSYQMPLKQQQPQQTKFVEYKGKSSLKPKNLATKDQIHCAVINFRNFLMALWKCYEQLGREKQFEAAFLMGEKLSKQLMLLQDCMTSKQLKYGNIIGNVTPQNWQTYCNSGRAQQFLNQRLVQDTRLLIGHFQNLGKYMQKNSQNALKQSKVMQSNFNLRKGLLLSAADQQVKKGNMVQAMDLILFADLDFWLACGISIEKYEKRKLIPKNKQKLILTTGQFNIFIPK